MYRVERSTRLMDYLKDQMKQQRLYIDTGSENIRLTIYLTSLRTCTLYSSVLSSWGQGRFVSKRILHVNAV